MEAFQTIQWPTEGASVQHTHTHNESFATTGGPMRRGGIGECDVDGWSRVSDVDSTGSFKYITLVNVSV